MAEETNEVIERMIAQHMEVLSIPGGVLGYQVATSDMGEVLAELEITRSELAALKEEHKAFRVFAHKTIRAVSNAELEAVRAERDALRAALEAVRGECNWDYHSLDAMLRNITHIVDTALNTQPAPQAEWTPKVGDRVRFVEGDKVGIVERIDETAPPRYSLKWEGEPYFSRWMEAGELAPVDESEVQAEWTPRFVVGETVRVDRFIDDAFAGWLGEIEQIKRVGDTCEYYLAAKNHPGFERYPFGWFAEKLLDNNDNVPDWVEGMDKEAK